MLGHPIQLPGEFFDLSNHDSHEPDPDAFVSKFRHYVASLRFMPTCQADRASYLDKNLFSSATTRDVEAVIFQSLPLPLTKNEKTTLYNFLTFVGL